MKKIYFLAAGCALALTASAQQLANPDFEAGWGDCIPWTFYQSEEEYFGQPSEVVTGSNPTGWVISNVCGMASCYPDEEGVLQSMGLGATVVGSPATGFESDNAVQLTNNPNPFLASQIVPAYLTLGTTWSTANPTFGIEGITINNADGGTFGGIPFTGRPTGIEFMYKRSESADAPGEPASLVAYLWKGHWTQKDVPAIIYMAGEPYTTDMVDRDRCILGIEMSQGGEVTKSDDAELIAVINAEIVEVGDEWMKYAATFDYKSDATPEYLNIIFAAGNYFGDATKVVKDNSLTVDNVKLIYGESEGACDKYPGKLTIEMGGSSLTETPMDAEINITYAPDLKTCTLTLPNFSLDLGGGAMPLGDIIVPDVEVGVENGLNTYVGAVKNFSLLDGMIVADVDVNGTIDKDGKAAFNINVIWESMPIVVIFNGEGNPGPGTSAVINVEASHAGEVEYFNLNGVRIQNPAGGVFIKRQGNKVSKVVIR